MSCEAQRDLVSARASSTKPHLTSATAQCGHRTGILKPLRVARRELAVQERSVRGLGSPPERGGDGVAELSGVGVDRNNGAAREQVAELEGLVDRCLDDERDARIAGSQPTEHLPAVRLLELEGGDDEVGAFDRDTGFKPMQRATCCRVGGRVGPAADTDAATDAPPDLARQLQRAVGIGVLDQHAWPIEKRPRLQVDRASTLPHARRNLSAVQEVRIREFADRPVPEYYGARPDADSTKPVRMPQRQLPSAPPDA